MEILWPQCLNSEGQAVFGGSLILVQRMPMKNSSLHLVFCKRAVIRWHLLPAFHFGDCVSDNYLYGNSLVTLNVSTLVYFNKMCQKVNIWSTQEGLPGKIFTCQ